MDFDFDFVRHSVSFAQGSSYGFKNIYNNTEVIETRQGIALGSAFGLTAIAANVGLNPIVGAFAVGIGLGNKQRNCRMSGRKNLGKK